MRSLQNLRTLSGRGEQTASPYRAYMKLGFLEMEKVRKVKEKRGAELKIQIIDRRLLEIEGEKHAILQGLGERIGNNPPSQSVSPISTVKRSPAGITLKY